MASPVYPQSPNSIGHNRFILFTNKEDNITATPSGTQANAYQLQAQSNRVTTVGTTVALPKIKRNSFSDANMATAGQLIVVRNDGANTLQVYGGQDGYDTINGVASATGISVPAAQVLFAWVNDYTPSTNVGTWYGYVAGGTGLAIGSTVTSGTLGSVLFVGAGPALSQDNANFNWKGAGGVTNLLSVDKLGTATLLNIVIGAQNFSISQATGKIASYTTGVIGWSSSASVGVNAVLDTGVSRISAGLIAAGNGSQADFTGRIKLTSVITAAVTVANLNAAPTIGEVQTVNNALAVTVKGATVSSGGTAVCQVMWNGSNWVGI